MRGIVGTAVKSPHGFRSPGVLQLTTQKKIAAFVVAGLAALLIGFVLFAYYNFTHNFHIALSDQQASDIETALKGSLGDAIFSGQ